MLVKMALPRSGDEVGVSVVQIDDENLLRDSVDYRRPAELTAIGESSTPGVIVINRDGDICVGIIGSTQILHVEQLLQGLDAAAVGKYYVGKTEGQISSTSDAPWLSEAMQAIRRHMKRPKQQALIKACKPTQATPLQLQLSYARIASEEGVAAMEARAVELKRKKPGSQNSLSGLAAAGGEGWLYFWDVTDTRFP
jgi:hypothetical protein